MDSTVVEIVKELTQVHDVVAADGTIIHNNICKITCKPSIL
jgi:hypothetical protein